MPITAASCWRTPVWRFTVYDLGRFFPWFGRSSLGRNTRKIGTVVVNHVECARVDRLEDLREKTFCQQGPDIYVYSPGGNPLWLYHKPQFNTVFGFTDEESLVNEFFRTILHLC
jgi:hypothetical protein